MNVLLSAFDRRFEDLHERSMRLIAELGDELLYQRPREIPNTFAMFSVGEFVIRSAAAVEQTFGGITTRLWDDPFEWTLPEKLTTTRLVSEYLNEADETRRKGMAFLTSDEDLGRRLPAPEQLVTIADLLLDTLARAEHFQGRAFTVFQMFSDAKLPKV